MSRNVHVIITQKPVIQIPIFKTQFETMLGNISESFKLNDYSIYIVSGAPLVKFIKEVESYSYNNPVDEKHVSSIIQGIIKLKTLDNAINVIKDNAGILRIIDGQHRATALRKLDDAILESKQVVMHVYNVDDINGDIARQLFCRLNNIKPFRINATIHELVFQIITSLRTQSVFNLGIKDNGRPTAFTPYYSINQVHDILTRKLTPVGVSNIIVERIVKIITLLNNQYREICNSKSPNQIFIEASSVELATKKVSQMITTGFYLSNSIAQVWPELMIDRYQGISI